jgi:hypothetical protein
MNDNFGDCLEARILRELNETDVGLGVETPPPDSEEDLDDDDERRARPHTTPKKTRLRPPPPPIQYSTTDLNLSELHDPRTDYLRAHPPIPEREFECYKACVEFYRQFARNNGLLFNQQRWHRDANKVKYKCTISCSLARRRKEIPVCDRVRPGAKSSKTACPYAFYIVALDRQSDDLQTGRWRILHQKGKSTKLKSLCYNHPPLKNLYVNAYPQRVDPQISRPQSRPELVDQLASLFEDCEAAKGTLDNLTRRLQTAIQQVQRTR